jgi:hypothetical protein
MLLNFFDDVLRLDLALETAKGILQRLSLLKPDFSHSTDTPQLFKVLFLSLQLAEINEFLRQCQERIRYFPTSFTVQNCTKASQKSLVIRAKLTPIAVLAKVYLPWSRKECDALFFPSDISIAPNGLVNDRSPSL